MKLVLVIQIASAVKVTFKCKLLSVPLLGSEKTSCWGFLAKSSLLSLLPTHHPPLAPGQPRHAMHCLVIYTVLVLVDSLEMRISDECTSLVSDQPTHTMNR